MVYGLVGLKTHCKLAMVVRDEPDGIRRYTHIGTGNYNPKTSRMYEDLGLITTHEQIGEDVAHLFNNLSGWSRNASYEELLVAPDSAVRPGRPDPPGDPAPPGRPAGADPDEGQLGRRRGRDRRALPRLAGRVPIQLLVRGICSLRPQVAGLSETVEVRSILGRFLEHSQVFWFENGGDPNAWIGSADMMHRN